MAVGVGEQSETGQSKEFITLSGFMPAGAVLLDHLGKPSFEFGKDHRNTVKWSPLRRFVLICGFGTLDGSIDMWDTIQLKKVGFCKWKSTSVCCWSPCGRKVLNYWFFDYLLSSFAAKLHQG